MGLNAPSETINSNEVGQNFEDLLGQLYQSAPGQYQEQATYQPEYTAWACRI